MNARSRFAALVALCVAVAGCGRGSTGTATLEEATTGDVTEALSPTTTPPSTSPPVSTGQATTTSPITPASSTPTTSVATPTTVTTTTPPESSTDSPDCVAGLSLAERVALLVWPAAYTDDWDEAVRAAGELNVGGMVLMTPGDGVSESELTGMIAELDAASQHGILISTDEEGGNVQRLRAYSPLASQEDVSDSMDPGEAAELIEAHGARIAEIGIDVVLGPVVDVRPTSGETAIQPPSRLFVGGPDNVAEYGAAYVQGWQAAGLLPVLKHFPGHGSATGDTHTGSAETPPLAELEQRDLVPYREIAELGTDVAVMMGHLTVPGLTDGKPASLSPDAVTYLRDELGYGDALVMTDALGMDAVGMSVPTAAVTAITAGVDVVIFTESDVTDDVIDALVQAVDDDRIPEARIDEAAGRVLRQLAQHGGGC